MGRQAGVVERLRSALGRGGLAGAKAVLWPKDLPASAAQAAFQLLPPFVHPAFRMPQPRPDRFPGDFIYFPGPFTAEEAGLLKAAWLLIVPVTGDALSLLVSGFSEKGYQDFCQALQQNDLPPPMEATPPEANLAATNLAERAAAIQHAAAVVVLPRMAAWGDPVSQALACAAALVAPETPWSDARVGPAGYLVPENDARAIAAAVLTLVNQPEVAGQLRQAARLRSAGWEQEDFRQDLLEIYSACARVYPRRRTAA
jgi:glycosyltransferase involved in cell wall biosynthesis